MSTITTLNQTDNGSTSRTTINTNFTNLNTDKQEKGAGVSGNIVAFGASNVLTDTGKVAPTGAIVGDTATQTLSNKTISGASNTLTVREADLSITDVTTANVSTTAHGFTPKAPNNTSLFLRGDGTWAAPATGSTAATQIVPMSNFVSSGTSGLTITANTILYLGQISIPYTITANKISFNAVSTATPGTCKIALFSQSGGTQIFSVTTATISGAGIKTTALSSVSIAAGIYYIAILGVSTTAIQLSGFATTNTSSLGTNLNGLVSGNAILEGTLTITADTMPATISPTSITSAVNNTLIVRFDN